MQQKLLQQFLSIPKEQRKEVVYSLMGKIYTLPLLYRICLDNLNNHNRGTNWVMPPIHEQWLEHFQTQERFVAIFAPRGFSKSTTLKVYCIDEIVERRQSYIIYVSSSYSKATEQFEGLISILKDQRLQVIKGYTIIKQNSTEVEIRFQDGTTSKIEAVGQGADILGKNYNGTRPGLILIDDLEELDQAKSVQRTNALQNWMFTTLIPTLPSLKEGKVRYIGTILTKNSLANRIKTNARDEEGQQVFSDWTVHLYQALQEDKSIWEERHPTESLKQEQQTRPRQFAANYMNAPLDEVSGIVSREMLNYFQLSHFNFSSIKAAYAHFDLNVETKDKSDYFAGVLLGRDSENKIYVLDIIHTKLNALEQADAIINFWVKWTARVPLQQISIDGVAYQRTLKPWIDQEARRKGIYPNVKAISYNKDKYTHFLLHEPLFASRSVWLPSDHEKLTALEQELLVFPEGQHDDLIDSLSFTADNFVNQKPKVGFKGKLIQNL
jgi:predicted phage terminase large subunit-like protein